jgi:hypothetical protein
MTFETVPFTACARRHQVADARAAVRDKRDWEWGFGHPL